MIQYFASNGGYVIGQSASELMQSARSYHSIGVLLSQAAVLIVAFMFLMAACSTVRKGFSITKYKKVTGKPAYSIAAIFILVALGIAIFALLYLPGMAF